MYKGPKYAAVYKQVCVEPRSSAPNMTLPVFAAERRLQAYRLSIDICCRRPTVLSSKPAGRRCFAWMGQTDGRMDGRTSDCAIEPASHNMRAARIRLNILIRGICEKVTEPCRKREQISQLICTYLH